MKRVALLLVASFLGSIAVLPAAETEVPAKEVTSKSNYRKGKKVRRSKSVPKRAKRRAPRRNTVN